MAIFDNYADKPNQIKEEGQEITLRFSRIDDNTGKLSWNIPPSQSGCKGNGTYNGIVLTVSRKPANYISTSPKDGQYYIGDPSVDEDLHSGSKIEDGVMVVGAFYDDRETTELELVDLQPRTSYYFSAYAVDNVARYHREGAHSYSLPTGIEESGDEEQTPAKQIIQIEEPVKLKTTTGLDKNKDYKIDFATECDAHKIIISGRKALTYKDMVEEINHQMMLLDDPYKSPTMPFKSSIFKLGDIFYKWDGQNKVELEYVESDIEPNTPVEDTLWYNTETNKLFVYEVTTNTEGWEELDFVETAFDITEPPDGTVWFDGTDAWEWKHDRWCKLNTIIDTRNPLLPPKLNSSTYWYNTETLELYKWNRKIGKWDEAIAIYYPSDPNELLPGSYWFNETDEKVYILQTGGDGWTELHNVRYVEEDENDALPKPIDGSFWYIPSDQILNRWYEDWVNRDVEISSTEPTATVGSYWYNEVDGKVYVLEQGGWIELKVVSYVTDENDAFGDFWFDTDNLILRESVGEWIEQEIALFPTDPLDRKSCDLWWNSTPSVDYLFTWNELDEEWQAVDTFVQSEIDPSKSEKLPKNSVWYNPSDGKLLKILDTTCEELNFIHTSIVPTEPPEGFMWKWGTTFFQWNGSSWIEVNPISSPIDPFDMPEGSYWLDLDSSLHRWEDGEWEEVEVLDYDPKPEEGFLWFNTVDNTLYQWKVDSWVKTTPLVYATFHPATCYDEKDAIEFKTRKVGCDTEFAFDRRDSIFAHLKQRVRYFLPVEGQDLVSGVPSWQRLGVGDDGSPDERRELHGVIRELLGSPATKVELTKSQIDTCIDNSLKIIRKYGGQSYKRGFFFLDLNPNQQIYELKDRCVGFHQITHVNAVYRLRSAFLRGAYSGYDIFGYAALKQLYTLGTFDILSFHLVSSFIEELEHLFATRITFQWVERTRELKLYNSVHATERVLVDASIERSEQDLLVDRETNLWLQRWAVAEAKMMLSQSRGKFQSLPGPNGSTILNAQELITQSEAEKAMLMEELEDPSMSGSIEVGQKAFFVLG